MIATTAWAAFQVIVIAREIWMRRRKTVRSWSVSRAEVIGQLRHRTARPFLEVDARSNGQESMITPRNRRHCFSRLGPAAPPPKDRSAHSDRHRSSLSERAPVLGRLQKSEDLGNLESEPIGSGYEIIAFTMNRVEVAVPVVASVGSENS